MCQPRHGAPTKSASSDVLLGPLPTRESGRVSTLAGFGASQRGPMSLPCRRGPEPAGGWCSHTQTLWVEARRCGVVRQCLRKTAGFQELSGTSCRECTEETSWVVSQALSNTDLELKGGQGRRE